MTWPRASAAGARSNEGALGRRPGGGCASNPWPPWSFTTSLGLLVERPRRPYPVLMAKADRSEPTPFEKFEEAARRIFQVPKRDVEKAELRRKKEKEAREAERQQGG